jgi:hypothetical protein
MPHKKDEQGHPIIPTVELAGSTLVVDRERQEVVMRIKKVLILPVGAIVELSDPDVDATVVAVRLLAGTTRMPATVCLDVLVPPAYWEFDADTDEPSEPRPSFIRPPAA